MAVETTLLFSDDDDHWNNYSNAAAAAGVVVGIVEGNIRRQRPVNVAADVNIDTLVVAEKKRIHCRQYCSWHPFPSHFDEALATEPASASSPLPAAAVADIASDIVAASSSPRQYNYCRDCHHHHHLRRPASFSSLAPPWHNSYVSCG